MSAAVLCRTRLWCCIKESRGYVFCCEKHNANINELKLAKSLRNHK